MQGNCGTTGSLRPSQRHRLPLVRAAAAALASVLIAPAALRANNVYTATGPGGYWSSTGTWVSNTVPTSAIDTELDFGGTGADANTFTDDIGSATFTLNEIQLNSTSTGTQTIAASAAANTLTFVANSLLAAPQILQNGSGAYVINNGLVLNNTLTLGGSGTGAIGLVGTISGTGGLTLNGPYTVTLTGQNTFTGNITINGGILQAAVATATGYPSHPIASALGNATRSGRSLTVNGGGQLVFAVSNVLGSSNGATDLNLGITINAGGEVTAAPGTNNILAIVTLNGGTLVTNVGTSATLQSFYLQPGLMNVGGTQPSKIVATGSVNNGIHLSMYPTFFNVADVTNDARPDLTVSATLLDPPVNAAGTLRKAGPGTLVLAGNNTYSGGTIVDAGVLDLNDAAGSVPATSNLTFNGTGSFVYENSGAQSNRTQPLNQITFSGGDGTVEVDDNAGQVIALAPQYAIRSAGATGNFVVHDLPASSKAEVAVEGMGYFLNQGTFFNGGSYAYVDPNSTVLRAIQYGTVQSHALTDSGAVTFSGGSTVTPSGITVSYAQTTGPISGQPTATLTTLNLASNDIFSLATGATLTVNGILKSGNSVGGATITGGTGIQGGGSGTELVIRTDGVNDALTINTPVLNNGGNLLTKSGLGTLTFGGVNTYSGATTLNAGTVTFAGSSGSTGGGALIVGGTAGIATLNVATSGTLIFGPVSVGGVSGSASNVGGGGAVDQSAGTVDYSNGTAGGILLGAGGGTGVTALPLGGYGAYDLSGGTLSANGNAANVVVGSVGLGNFTQTGGSFLLGGQWTIGDTGSGIATLTGGTTTGATGYGISIGNSGVGTLNLGTLAGGTATLVSQSTAGMQLGNSQTGTGLLNLNAGMLALGAGSIHKWTLGSAVVNWNGATLRAAASGLTLIDSTVDAVNVYNGGAVVDTHGFNATIAAPLIGTTGNGIYPSGGTLNLPSSGAGYIGAPLVTVSGGSGSGVTAIANVANGAITGVTLTNPGQNYQAGDVLTFTFAGGGSATPAPAAQYTLQLPDVSLNGMGGLTKLGSGTLVLTGASTYTGATSVMAGTLQVDGSLADTPVSVAAGAALAGRGAIGNAGPNAVTVAGTVAPGDPATIATLATGPMTWAAGGAYRWKVSQLPGGSAGPGTGWDDLIVSSLSVTALSTPGSQFTIAPTGAPAGIQLGTTYRWPVAQIGPAGGPVGGFDPAKFVLDTSQFAGGAYPASDFSVANTGNEVDVVFTPAPEPSSMMLFGVAAGAGLARRRRRG